MFFSKSGSYFIYFPGDETLSVISVIKYIEQSVYKLIAIHRHIVLGLKDKKMNFYIFYYAEEKKFNTLSQL